VHSRFLSFFTKIASNSRHVLCIRPNSAIANLAQSLACKGAEVTCVECDEAIASRLSLIGIEATVIPLAEWMAQHSVGTLSQYEVLCLGEDFPSASWQLLKGRLNPSARLIVQVSDVACQENGKEGELLIPREWQNPELKQQGFWFFQTPPEAWHDPLDLLPSIDPNLRWPWNFPSIKASSTMPSGKPWPKISVVTVTYNQGEFIEETIRSVLLQGYPNLEYIIIDACSSDSTPAILERYRGNLTHCIIEPDNGQSDALNKGFRLATGDILAWLNSDDCYLPTALFRVAMAFDHYEADIIAGGCQLRKEFSSEVLKTHHSAMPLAQLVPLPFDRLMDIEHCWQRGEFFYQPEVFWSKELWSRCGGYLEEDLFYSMDYELWVRMAYHHAKIVHVPESLTLFRLHEQQKTYGEDIPFLPELKSVRDRYQRSH
ncbi:MAG: glycosyltransferase family 2 protein, partial [Cyanobacteria bacterium P01_E01_bin.6]